MPRPASAEKHTFYVPTDGFAGSNVVFPQDEAQHATRVLRLGAGDVVHVVDGVGGRFRVRLDVVERKGVIGSVIESVGTEAANRTRVTLGFGLLKHAARYETILEKATELGVARLVPLKTDRTERVDIKEARSRAILVAAMKQSGGSSIPRLDGVTRLEEFLREAGGDVRFVCHESAPTGSGLARRLQEAFGPATPHAAPTADGASDREVTVLVGPEGGFTPSEIEAAQAAGFIPVSLGPKRLRTETAAVVAAALALLA